MAQTVVQICNTALARVGVSNFIDSLTEASQEAQVCNLFYEQARDRVLRDTHWPFARGYLQLSLVSQGTDTPWSAEWMYAYRYPTDGLNIWRILTPLGKRETVLAPFEIGSDEIGRLIFTDMKDATVEYTKRVEDPARFDPAFASALSWLLAAEIAMPLSLVDGLRKQALQMYQAEKDIAQRVAANEGEPMRDIDTEFLNTRGYYSQTGSMAEQGLPIFPSGFTVS
jgi:hypothetical protein